MSNLMDYVNSSLEGISDSDLLYKFKSGLIADLTERANEITHAGLGDKDLIDEIVISEHPDIRGEFLDYKKALAQKRAKKSAFRKKIVASILFIILMVTVYLLISIIRHNWSTSWVILVNSISLYAAYMIIDAVISLTEKKSVFYPIPRILIALAVFLFALPIFLVLQFLTHTPHAWLTFIGAVIVMECADGIFAEKMSERFAIFFHLAYIPVCATMLYIILAVTDVVKWSIGWLLIPASLLIVLGVIFVRIRIHNKQKFLEIEDDSEWKEN